MNQSIVKIGAPVLRRKTRDLSQREAVSSKVKAFTTRMVETMRRAQGVGLAANQVGDDRRILVMECRGNPRYPNRPSFALQTYLNARIVKYSWKKIGDWEGCLSIPGFRGRVPRSHSVILEALTLDGKKVRRTLKGFEARVIQHEVDHLDGLFYIDRMKHFKEYSHLDEFEKKSGQKIREKSRG
jgi:peptide deformylase